MTAPAIKIPHGWLNVPEAAALTRESQIQIRRWIDQKYLVALRYSRPDDGYEGEWYIKASSLIELRATLKAAKLGGKKE